jgi:hypothetical protein
MAQHFQMKTRPQVSCLTKRYLEYTKALVYGICSVHGQINLSQSDKALEKKLMMMKESRVKFSGEHILQHLYTESFLIHGSCWLK